MPGRAKKSTKKFEKNHLKDAIDKRKETAKIKQRQQTKVKKQIRNAADKAKASDSETEPEAAAIRAKGGSAADDLSKMSVDEFFQGGFQLPEQKSKHQFGGEQKGASSKIGKRKRDEDRLSDSASIEEIPAAEGDELDSEEEDGLEEHKGDLDALAEKDPDFYKYLKENDAELLDFNEDADPEEVGQLSEEAQEAPKEKKKQKKSKEKEIIEEEDSDQDDQSEVTMGMVRKWSTAMSEQHSLRAMRQAVLAFRAAAYVNSDDGKEHKYSISSPEIYHELLVTALESVPKVLSYHLPAKESTTGKICIATDSKKYRTLTPLLKSHCTSIHHLMQDLSDAATVKLTLSSLLPLLPYLLSFKKILRDLIKTTVNIWSESSSDEATRITAFLVIRRLAIISDASLREAVLKTVYQGLVKGSRITNMHTLAGINLMKNSAAELWGLDPNIGYTTGFTYIRQLAVHLRTSITHPTKDSYKTIYNWQYIHSLDFCTLAPLDFTTALRAPKPHLRTRTYQDALGAELHLLLSEFFACWSKHIAFPELILPPSVALKRWLKAASSPPSRGNKSSTSKHEREGKGNKNAKLNASIALLLQKMNANAQFIEKHRAQVSFGPSDREGVEGFLRDVKVEETPLGAFVEGMRRVREEKARVVEEGRREEPRGKGKDEGRRGRVAEGVDGDGVMDDGR